MIGEAITNIIDPGQPGSLTHHFRQRRNEKLTETFPNLAEMNILDLGGTARSWRASGLRARSVTIVNMDDTAPEPAEPWLHFVHGDACAGGLGEFDLVYSNSLLEHLGGHARRQQFAGVVRKSAPAWWVQTPYRYFPVEPHWIFPGLQFLPYRTRLFVVQHWSVLHTPAVRDRAEAEELVSSVELISASEMRSYFPAGQIWFERVAGIPKSMVSLHVA
jgi:hypothetical protein